MNLIQKNARLIKTQSKQAKQKPQKEARFEVDQSVRIEELNRDTVLAIASLQEHYSFLLRRKTKRYFNEYFRRLGKPRWCAPVLFVATIIVSLRPFRNRIGSLIVDTEYTGYESFIISSISLYYPKIVVSIKRIGKLSPAHVTAYGSHLGKIRYDNVLKRQDLERVIMDLNKNDGRRAASLGMNRDSQTHNRPVKKHFTKKHR